MRNWRTMVGALCIVLAMVLGAFAGFVYARPGVVGASSETGTRGEDRRAMSLSNLMNDAQVSLTDDSGNALSITELAPVEITSPDGAVAKTLTREEQRDAAVKSLTFESKDGTITATPSTRGSWPPGTVDANGPYGGPDSYEGSTTITFTVTANDPAIIFFRWDFDNDGAFDYPDQTGGGLIGKWTTLTSVDKVFNDNYYGDVVVQGWDGVSTTITIETGNNLGETTSIYALLGYGYYTFAYQFKSKGNLKVTQLGVYRYGYLLYSVSLWTTTGTKLAECTPTSTYYSWNWCTLATPVNLAINGDYRIGISVRYYAAAMQWPSDTSKVSFTSVYYCYSGSSSSCFPSTSWSITYLPMNDFYWEDTLIIPDVAQDEALLQIVNVPPIVGGVSSSPNPGLEGSATYLVAEFDDPGIDDTWEYRWQLPDGSWSAWMRVSKYSGGAKVLLLHSWSGSVSQILTSIRNLCGPFCVSVDDWDFGPVGTNTLPTLAELQAYDVIMIGTNYFNTHMTTLGDRLADYMDAAGSVGGGVIAMQFALDNAFGCQAGICGRYEDDGYSPVPRGYSYGSSGSMGTIYVPGHPLLDGVASLGTSAYGANIYSTNPGVTRIVDWNNGRVLAAVNENPMVSNGARAVSLNFFPPPEFGATSGDYVQLIVNAIKWASRQPDPVIKSMPIALDPYPIVFPDDHPTTTTPVDSFPVGVQVRDDDDGTVEIHSQTEFTYQNFQIVSQCSGYYYSYNTWPPGWSSSPNPYGWTCGANSYGIGRSPYILYYYNDPGYGTGDGHSYLYMPSVDMSSYNALRLEYYTYWAADYSGGNQEGFIEASGDGGATWHLLKGYYHNNPGRYQGYDSAETGDVGGLSSVVVRFRYESADDWWWAVDNIRVLGIEGVVIDGLGTGSGLVTIANVPPTVIGGFDSAFRTEAQSLLFDGFQISDPAILAPTEWFAYAWDFDDGTAVNWQYVGSLAPPKLDILVVQTLCSSGNSCGEFTSFRNMLLAQDDVGTVDSHNYFQLLSAPSLSTMMQYDVIIVAMNWAYYSYAPFDLARRQIGDRLAAYLDSGRGGALTFVGVHSTFGGYESWDIAGRYVDDKYGAFQSRTPLAGAVNGLGTIYNAGHDFFVNVGTDYNSMYVSSGDMPLSVGGNGNAAGRNGVLLADWSNGNTAIGVKELNNGARTGHIGAFAQPSGSDAGMLLRNAVGWVSGGIPSPNIEPFWHTWGDNGIYTVDFMAIDDDMGYVWDFGANMPMEVLPGAALSHRFLEVAVDNVDPVITGGVEAFIAAEACVRVSGTVGNSVTLNVYTDGVLSSTVSTLRMNGDPNPPTEKCGMVRVDVLAPHSYAATLTYSDPMGGSNPTWLIFSPWREPVTPGHGTITIKYDFDMAGTISQPLPTLKQDLLSGGDGAKIDFVAEASDVGTDDLAFMWVWGAEVIPKGGGMPEGIVYEIHTWHNDGSARTDNMLGTPHYLGFSEPYFDRTANDDRSPMGTMGFHVRDTAVHAFDLRQDIYYVVLIVLDDDNTRGYPSTFLNDGIDMEFILLDLA